MPVQKEGKRITQIMTILNAQNLSLEDVQRLFGFQEQYTDSFTQFLSLEAL